MNNVTEIRREAKMEIMEILDMCGCYNYTSEGIDQWLDVWEEACSPQIEAIAEKSPYYDGKCKIVFPSEFGREIDSDKVLSFGDWLNKWIARNVEPLKIEGRSYSEWNNIKYQYDKMDKIRRSLGPCSFDKLPEELQNLIENLRAYLLSTMYYASYSRVTQAFMTFSSILGISINGELYPDSVGDNKSVYASRVLANCFHNRNWHTQFLTEPMASYLNVSFPDCSFVEGQKLSRAVSAIASKYGLKKDPEWEREFAKFADAVNPLTIKKWTVISWHPVDYLTFCFGNSWSTCSNIDKRNVRGIKIGDSRSSVTDYVNEDYVFRGEHAAAALSYMFDRSSFIYYTTNYKYKGTNYEMQDKESRIVFSLSENMTTLLQSRLYPQCNDDAADDSNYRIPREIVQKVISDALEVPNLWTIKKGRDACCTYAQSTGVHYPDYVDSRNKNCNISYRGDSPETIYIGHDAICPDCGCTHREHNSLNCYDCNPES